MGRVLEPRGTWRKLTWWTVSQSEGTRILSTPPPLLDPTPVICAPSAPSGIKESVCWGPLPAASPLKSCEYHALCSRFQELLLLPGEFPSSRTALFPRQVQGHGDQLEGDHVVKTQGGCSGAPAPSLPLTLPQMIISCLRLSVACATVRLAGSCEGMKPTGAVASLPGNTPCPLAGAGLTSGTYGAGPCHLPYCSLPP